MINHTNSKAALILIISAFFNTANANLYHIIMRHVQRQPPSEARKLLERELSKALISEILSFERKLTAEELGLLLDVDVGLTAQENSEYNLTNKSIIPQSVQLRITLYKLIRT